MNAPLRAVPGTPTCMCGRPALGQCGVGMPGLQLILCREPVCSADGNWCSEHRHKKGTMGYPDWNPVLVDFDGYKPDGPGIWQAIKAKFILMLKTPQQVAQLARNEQMAFFEKDAPVPDMVYRINGRTFAARGNSKVMVEQPVEVKR